MQKEAFEIIEVVRKAKQDPYNSMLIFFLLYSRTLKVKYYDVVIDPVCGTIKRFLCSFSSFSGNCKKKKNSSLTPVCEFV